MLHVICGAPCSGKTTYVKEHASENALVIDADKIAHAFGGSDYHATGEPLKVALDARDLAINHALKSKEDAWLIDTMPNDARLKQYKEVNANIVVMDTSYDECIERAKERPDGTKQAIDKWFENESNFKNQLLVRRQQMNNTVNTVNEPETTTATEPERTFTQSELDAIVKDRLAREKGKYADYEELREKAAKFDEQTEASKSELQKATERAQALEVELNGMKKAESVRAIREKVAKETGIPATSLSLLTGETEDACMEQAKVIMSMITPNSYPHIQDGGEVGNISKGSAREDFKEFASRFNR